MKYTAAMPPLLLRHASTLKYLIAGGIATAINLSVLYVLVEYGRVHYLLAEVAAFVVSFFVNFFLQKFWTFKHREAGAMHRQMFFFLILSLTNLVCNTMLLYIAVQWLHVWYLLAEAGIIALLAFVSFQVNKRFIFTEGAHQTMVLVWIKTHGATILMIAGLVCAAFLATYKLTESPPTWFDEGIIEQIAMNQAQYGPHAVFQIAPGVYESAAYIGTTSYPLTYLIAEAFKAFGISLFAARSVMVIFILALVGCACLLVASTRKYLGAFALWFLVTFPPLYGDGKNVLGEIPGLVYLMIFLLGVRRIESQESSWWYFLGSGVFLGLAVATKPIFILVLPVVGIAALYSHRLFTWQRALAAVVGFAVPMMLWVWVQFGGQTLTQVLALYANPYGTDVASVLGANLRTFLHPEPLYALVLLVVWLASVCLRVYKKEHISLVEYIAAGFALLVYMAYLRTNGDYRYFFLGEVFALLYFPRSALRLYPQKFPRVFLYGLFVALIAFQIYACFARSWVAWHYNSHRTADITAAFVDVPSTASIFVFQAPEIPIFLPVHMPYYQYFFATKDLAIGAGEVPLIAQGVPDYVVLWANSPTKVDLSRYAKVKTFDRYELWQKK